MPSPVTTRTLLAAAAATDPGRRRENNEDRYHCDPARGVFIVIDGVGGQAAGERAADTALAMLRARLERETGRPAERIREAITLANNEVHRLSLSEPSWHGMACVLTVAIVRDGRLTVGHVGDTRLYEFREGGVRKLTHDHSPVGEREDCGDLDEAEAMRHPRRHEIYRDLGSEWHEPDDPQFIEIVETAFEPDTALLLCTDGLSDLVTSARLADIVYADAGDPARIVDRLVSAANDAGGKDNITAVFAAGPNFARAAAQPGARPAPATADTLRQTGVRAPAWLAGAAGLGIAVGIGLAGAAFTWVVGVADWMLETARPAAWSRTWRVGAGANTDVATIQEALRRAQPGDVVEVEPGLYRAPLVVDGRVSVISRRPHEAVIVPAAAGAPPARAVVLRRGARLVGFKVATLPTDAAPRFAVGVRVEGAGGELQDLEVTGTDDAAVEFAAHAAGVLRASYLFGNRGVAIVVGKAAHPALLYNVIAFNGQEADSGAAGNAGATPAVIVEDGAVPVLFGNIVARNAVDLIRGLLPAQQADVERDNILGAPLTRPAVPPRRTR
jgi:serine/threonine protein phosphatase PrpC